MGRQCPTPEKVGYATKRDALDAWRQIREGDRRRHRKRRGKAKTLSPYRCNPAWGCGAWHLGRRKARMRER